MRQNVLVVDHRCPYWRKLIKDNEFISDCELTIRSDGLEAYMELEDFTYDNLLIRCDLPGVTAEELVNWTAEKHSDTDVTLYGKEKISRDILPFHVDHIPKTPESRQDAREILSSILTKERTRVPV